MTKSSSDVEFKKFDYLTELDSQRDLFRECFPEAVGKSDETVDHYMWKFRSFPHTPPSYEYIATINNEIVGYYAALPFKYKFFGENVTIGMVCDVMTGLKARGKGVFTRLGIYSTDELKSSDLAFTTGYPIRPDVMPGHLKAGWNVVFELPLFFSFLKFNGLLAKKGLACISFIPNFFLSCFHRLLGLKSNIPAGFNAEIYQSDQINKIHGFSDFLNKWVASKNIVLDKTPEFYSWRLNSPTKDYKIICLSNDKLIVGVAIVCFSEKSGIPCMAVLDFMVLGDDKKYSEIMNDVLYKVAGENKTEVILVMMSKFIASKLNIFRKGYLKSPYKFSLIVKKFWKNLDDKQLNDEKNWYLMWIDSDNFQ